MWFEQPVAQRNDLRAIRDVLRADEILTGRHRAFGVKGGKHEVAAIARMMAEATIDYQIDLASTSSRNPAGRLMRT